MVWTEIFKYEEGKLLKYIKARDSFVEAGYVNPKGYRIVMVLGKNYRAHRIVWEMHNGPIPEGYDIDHINHIRDDNRIENLRIVLNQVNHLNMSLYKNNESGVPGVRWRKDRQKWVARITHEGKIMCLGSFDKLEEAIEARLTAQESLPFHKNHGKA